MGLLPPTEAERARTLLSLRDDRDDRRTRHQVAKGPLADRDVAATIIEAERERQDDLRDRVRRELYGAAAEPAAALRQTHCSSRSGTERR